MKTQLWIIFLHTSIKIGFSTKYRFEVEYSRSVVFLLVVDRLVAAEAAPLTDLAVCTEGASEGRRGGGGGEHDGRLGGALGYDAPILIAPS